MPKMRLLLVACLLTSTVARANPPTQHVVWDKTPIAVTLPIGEERRVHFPLPVEVDTLQSTLTEEQLTLLNYDGTLYLKAHQNFPTTRLAVRLHNHTAHMVVDITGTEAADTHPIQVLLPKDEPDEAPLQLPGDDTTAYAKLLRFAIQQLYAPQRLIQSLPGLYRAPLRTPRTVRLLRHTPVVAQPLATWQGGAYTVTAVQVRNTTQRPLQVSVDKLLGNWLAVVWYPNTTLAPHGQPKDSTVAFLLSEQPFAESVSCV